MSIDNFIKNLKKYINIVKKIDINNQSNLKSHNDIVQTILLGYNESKYINLTPNILSYKLIKGNSFNHIPIIIRKKIINHNSNVLQYSFNINKRTFNIFFHIFDDKQPSKNVIQQIYNILFLFDYYSQYKSCNKVLNIYIYLCEELKMLPSSFKVLDREHINSAFTYSCSINNEIYIFRKEEWFKSIIHESMHAFGFDFSQNYSKHNDIYSSKIIQKHFFVNFDLSLYESYVDMFAIYINSLFFSFYKTYNKSSPDFVNRVLTKTNYILNNELLFSMFQTSKILTYYNINYTDLFSNSKTLHLYDENTPVFSYFIIKTILFFNFNKFFSWCIQNNSNIFDFECTNKSKNNNKLTCNKKIKLFCNFIIQNHNDYNLIHNLNKLQQFFINTNNNNFIFKTLRFSIYG